MTTYVDEIRVIVRFATHCVVNYSNVLNPEHNIVGHICQYGDLHLHLLNKKAERLVMPNILFKPKSSIVINSILLDCCRDVKFNVNKSTNNCYFHQKVN
jgi:hypothetical protein